MAHEPVRFAYVGCGFVAQRIHIPNFSSLAECKFVALAEVRSELGERVARRYAITKLYKSHEEIARDPEIEAVGVSAPPRGLSCEFNIGSIDACGLASQNLVHSKPSMRSVQEPKCV